MAPGAYRILGEKEGYATASADIEIQVGLGGVVELRMSPSPGLTVLVIEAQGQPARAAEFVALDGADHVVYRGRHTAGEDQRIRLEGIPAGAWTLLVSGQMA